MKKRIIATILSFALIFTSVPWAAIDVFAASHSVDSSAVGNGTYISDSNTINSWKNYFKPSSTEYAGMVWTDKAVFVKNDSQQDLSTEIPSDFENLDKMYVRINNGALEMTTNGKETVTVEDENFLVAMSALGSTKEISGYSTLPTDTVFVLDVSNSMNENAKRQMVEATNKAIGKLYAVNKHNRVGVAVYGTTASVLLDVDRYTTEEGANTNTPDPNDDYKVYVELTEGGAQIISARKTETTKATVNITQSEYTDIARYLNNVSGNNKRNTRAQYLEQQLPASKTGGVDIDWYSRLNGTNNTSGQQRWYNWLVNAVDNETTVTNTTYLKDSDGEDVVRSVNANGGTFVQGGLQTALNLFNACDPVIETGLIQGGISRLPIAVIMSDGAATFASTNYTNVGSYNLGNGSNNSISDNLVFPTQLTAAYLNQQVERHYGREMLIYTLGLLDPETAPQEAFRTLDPSRYTSTNINNFWNSYESTRTNNRIDGYTNATITRKESNPDSLTNYRYYVDKYFGANNADDLVNAFNSIVETIILQSKYYPTLVESGKYNLDGYVTFEDELGEFMEVKDIKGIVLGNEIYTGDAFLHALNDTTAFGSAAQSSLYGDELVATISERLNIDKAAASTLLMAAWRSGGTDANGNHNNAGQLHTDNYIGWYADANGNYLGHWDDELHTTENYPSAAKYLNKCYIFQGDLDKSDTSSVSGGDMMHVIVQVHEEIATGHQCVRLLIPANLIPLVTYNVSIDTNSLVTAQEITLDMETTNPIRLLYEVGLSDEINDVNMTEVVSRADHSHPVVNGGKTVGYAFYSNRWGEGHTLDGSGNTDKLDPTDKLATVAHLNPSKENERYYYTEDTLIYHLVNGTYQLYKGTNKPSGDGFYRVYSVIEKADGTNAVTVNNIYIPIAQAVLSATGALAVDRINDAESVNNGAWYVPAGQIYQQTTRLQVQKGDAKSVAAGKDGTTPAAIGNVTGTLPYYDYPYVTVAGAGAGYNIHYFLGNNGRLVKYAAQGIKLTKTIDDASIAAGTKEFVLVVQLSDATGVKLGDATGNDITAAAKSSGRFAVNGNTATVKIKNGETVYLTGLATGTTYTVTENHHPEYVVKSASGETVTGSGKTTTVSGTVEQYVIDSAEFVNMATTHMGNLVVSKTVTHPYGDNYEIPVNGNTVFKVNVTLTAPQGDDTDVTEATFEANGTVKYKNGTEYATGLVKSVTTDANGAVVTVTLADNTVLTNTATDTKWWLANDDSFTVMGIGEDVEYTVAEDLTANKGFEQDTVNSKNLAGKIVSDDTVYAELVNKYNPQGTTSAGLKAKITKKLDGRNWQDGDEFSFFLQKYVPATGTTPASWVDVPGVNVTIKNTSEGTGDSRTASPDNAAVVHFTVDDIGTSYFRIGEVKGNISGITYDETYRYYSVTVYDADMDGTIKVRIDNYQGVTVTADTAANTYLLETTFTNYHSQAVANISLHKNLTNNSGVDVSMNEFEFEFCTAEGCTKDAGCPNAEKHLTLKPNANGDLAFPQNYVENDLADVTQWTYTVTETVTVASDEGTEGTDGTAGTEGTTGTEGAAGTEGTAPVTRTIQQTVTKTAVEGQAEIPAGATKSKTFTYYLWEKLGTDPAMVYDKSVYKVEIAVTVTKGEQGKGNTIAVTGTTVTKVKDANGNAIAAADQAASATATANTAVMNFSNRYEVLPVSNQLKIKGSKNLEGRAIRQGEFTFALYQADSSFAKQDSNTTDTDPLTAVTTVTTAGGGKTEDFVVNLPGFDKKGIFYFVLEETAGNNASITYDKAVYHITVATDVKSGTNQLVVTSVTVNQLGGATGTYIVPEGTTGDITITGTAADTSVPVVFSNKYTIRQNANAAISGDKNVTNKAILQDEFEFGLYADQDCTIPVYVDANGIVSESGTAVTAKTAAVSGIFTFNLIYNQPFSGTYYIKEIGSTISYADGSHMSYDTSVKAVSVNVTDANGDGVLTATVTNADGSAHNATSNVFTNEFTPTPVTSTVVGTKQFVTESNTPVMGEWPEFKYRMYVADKDFNVTDDVAIDSITLGKSFSGTYTNTNGDVSFTGTTSEYTDKEFELRLTFPQVGSYYYILKEVDEDNGNILYDSKEYYLTFIVTDTNSNGNLTVNGSMKLGGNVVSTAAFKNQQITQSVDVDIDTFKKFENNTSIVIPMNTFEFGLYKDAACTEKATDASGNPIVSNAATNGDASFSFKFTNDQLGTYTYYLRENIPESGREIVGMTYDKSVYQAVIKVANDANGKLYATSAVKQIVDAEGRAITTPVQTADNRAEFSNTFHIDPTKVIISGTKALTGRDMAEGEFEFALYNAEVQTDASGAVTSWTTGAQIGGNVTNAGKTFTFPEMEYDKEETVYYVVKEVPGTAYKVEYDVSEYLVKVEVVNGGKGSFVATQSVAAKRVDNVYTFATDANPLQLSFTNKFTPDPVVASITGTKTLTGDERYDNNNVLDGIRNGEFTFDLYVTDHNYNIEGKTPVKTVNNGDNPATTEVEKNIFIFKAEKVNNEYVTTDPLYFTDAGTHYFVVKEKAGTDNTIAYDSKEYNVQITVTKADDGTLSYTTAVTNAGNADTVSVTNTYDSKTADAAINIKKNLENNTNVALDIRGFEFALYESNGTTPVYKDNNGFVVPSTAAGATAVVANAQDDHGNAVITLRYTDLDYANDADHSFSYVLKEVNSGKSGVVYDSKAYTVDVTLSYNADKQLVAAVKVDNVANKTAVFNNRYVLPAAQVTISGSKVYDGWNNAATEGKTFDVYLYATDERGNYAAPGSTQIAKATVSKGTPTFTFTSANATDANTDAATAQLSFSAAGKYYFVAVEENAGLTTGDIIYDGKQYVTEVTVAPDNAANPTKLVATTKTHVFGHSEQVGATGNAVTGVVFTNTDLAGKTTVDIVGKKALTGRTIIDKEFDFELYKADENWNLVDSDSALEGVNPWFETVNRETAADQKFDGFNVEFIGIPLEYTATGTGSATYRYVVKELNTGMPTITYDETEYRIKVDATFDNGSYVVDDVVVTKRVKDGSSYAETSITSAYNTTDKYIDLTKFGTATTPTVATFTNAYNPKYTSSTTDAVIPISKTLANTTGVALNETFKFGLYSTYTNGALSEPVKVYKAGGTTDQIKDNLVLTDGTGTEVVATVTNAGETSITLRFSDSLYAEAAANHHKLTYYLAEINGEKAGMKYDGTVYQIDIILSYNAEKQLVATKNISEITSGVSSASNVEKAIFENEYALDSAEIVLSGTKVLPQHEIYKDDFTFVMYEAVKETDGTVVTVPGSAVWTFNENVNTKLEEALNETKANAGSNDYDVFTFSKRTFDTIGEYHYIIVEKAGSLGNGKVSYDESRYQVTVKVEADDADTDGDGKKDELIAKVSVQKVVKNSAGEFAVDATAVTAADIVFNNEYTPEGSFTISGEKLIENREWAENDEFTFNLYKTDSDFAVDSDAVLVDSNTVKESDSDRIFEVEATIKGTDNDKANLYDTHYYVLVEEAGNIGAIGYDDTKYHITVTAKDNLDGTLTVGKLENSAFTAGEFDVTKVEGTTETPLDPAETIEFVNEYLTQDAKAVVSGKKVLENANIRDYKGDFTFELHRAVYDDSAHKWIIADPFESPATTTNSLEDGAKFEFKDVPMLKFNTTGTYHFIVKEAQGTHPIITYNTGADKEFVVKVEVKEKLGADNKVVVNNSNEAVLEATTELLHMQKDEIEFTNRYNPTSVNFNIEKTLSFTHGATHTLGGFVFKIEGVGNSTSFEATSGNDGKISVPVSYTENDLDVANGYGPKTYTYTITEVDTGIERMTYDNTVHTIEVTVYAENGELKTSIKQNGYQMGKVEVFFNNTYNGIEEVPDDPVDPGHFVDTSDTTNIALYTLILALSTACLISMLWFRKRRKEDEEAQA